MQIDLGYDFNNNKIITKKETPINNNEVSILKKIIDDLNLKDAVVNTNTTDYTTLNYKHRDIVRLKYTDKTKWISIYLTDNDKKEYIDSPLFEAQKKKTQFLWKSKLENDDLNQYYKFIKNSCDFIDEIDK